VGYLNTKQIKFFFYKTQSSTNPMLKSEIKNKTIKKKLNPNKLELACKTRDLDRETEITQQNTNKKAQFLTTQYRKLKFKK